MNTRKTTSAAVKVSARAAGKAISRASAHAKPRNGAKDAPAVSKVRAAAPLLKTAAKPAASRTTPAAKRTKVVPQPMLKLVTAPPAAKAPARTGKRVPPTEPQDKVRIFQIYYRPEQRQYLDPAFEPYNNEGDNSPLLEFNVFRKLMNSELLSGAGLWGALSWKFKEKTGLSGAQLLQIIADHPGQDVYYCNPFPELEALYHNLWLQGEPSHPNFLILCRDFFQAAGLDESAFTQLVPSSHFAASNYFIATPAFWRGYAGFVSDVIERAERGMSATARAMIYSAAADRKAMHAGASYMPFIVERLFGVYLSQVSEQYKIHKFSCEQQEQKMNVHLRLLRQMKDVAISSKSLWLATCWVNYRNVYMQQLHGADWCKRYLRDITPVQVKF
jgi:hypothetical protein